MYLIRIMKTSDGAGGGIRRVFRAFRVRPAAREGLFVSRRGNRRFERARREPLPGRKKTDRVFNHLFRIF